jgi:prepilin-type N-terminal cleavage/methylation domain-containing protein
MRPSKQKQHSPQSSQAGFTIIESLMAIIIVTILMVAIGPVVVMSVAVRVQARRVERASEAAKTYIDSVNSGKTPAPPIPVQLRGSSAGFLKDAPAPAASDFPPKVDWSKSSKVYCVDLDSTAGCSLNSSRDLVIQAFRNPSAPAADNPAQGYRLGVRVYRADAFKGSGPSKTITKEQSALKGNLGARDVPLATMITDIAPQGDNNSLPTWCTRLSKNPKNPGC